MRWRTSLGNSFEVESSSDTVYKTPKSLPTLTICTAVGYPTPEPYAPLLCHYCHSVAPHRVNIARAHRNPNILLLEVPLRHSTDRLRHCCNPASSIDRPGPQPSSATPTERSTRTPEQPNLAPAEQHHRPRATDSGLTYSRAQHYPAVHWHFRNTQIISQWRTS